LAVTRSKDGAHDETHQIGIAEIFKSSSETCSAAKALTLGSSARSTALVRWNPEECLLGLELRLLDDYSIVPQQSAALLTICSAA